MDEPPSASDWVEVSPRTVEQWREHAWRGRVDGLDDAGGCKGGSSGDDSFAGPGTVSACGESLAGRDASMSGCSRRVAAPFRRARARHHKAPCACALFGVGLPRGAPRPKAAR